MLIIGIDPGPLESSLVVLEDMRVETGWHPFTMPNADMLSQLIGLSEVKERFLAIEMIQHMGMPAGAELFETCVWIGRFMERFGPERTALIPRGKVKNHICGSSRAKDANIRQALIDRLGPRGTKENPGPTYGIKGHEWQALAVAVTYADLHAG